MGRSPKLPPYGLPRQGNMIFPPRSVAGPQPHRPQPIARSSQPLLPHPGRSSGERVLPAATPAVSKRAPMVGFLKQKPTVVEEVCAQRIDGLFHRFQQLPSGAANLDTAMSLVNLHADLARCVAQAKGLRLFEASARGVLLDSLIQARMVPFYMTADAQVDDMILNAQACACFPDADMYTRRATVFRTRAMAFRNLLAPAGLDGETNRITRFLREFPHHVWASSIAEVPAGNLSMRVADVSARRDELSNMLPESMECSAWMALRTDALDVLRHAAAARAGSETRIMHAVYMTAAGQIPMLRLAGLNLPEIS